MRREVSSDRYMRQRQVSDREHARRVRDEKMRVRVDGKCAGRVYCVLDVVDDMAMRARQPTNEPQDRVFV